MKRTNRLSTVQAAKMVDDWVRHGDRRSLDAINKNQTKLGNMLTKARKEVKRRIQKNIGGEVDKMVDLQMNELVTQVNGQLGTAWFNKTETHNEEVAIKLSRKDEAINQITIEMSRKQEVIENLTEQKNNLEARVDDTMAKVEEKSAELDRANNALQNTGRELVNERAKNEETERRLQEAEDNLGRIDNENVQLRDRLNRDNIDHQLQMEELRQQLSDANLERATANLRLEEMEADIQHANAVIQDHEQRATAMQNTINAKNQTIKNRDALLQSARAQYVATNANLEQLRSNMQENFTAED